MAALITNSQFYTFTNTVCGSTDTLISQLISAASVQIENYCDRKFFKDLYIYWLNSANRNCYNLPHYGLNSLTIFPRALPIVAVVYNGEVDTALTITNNNSTPYTFSVNNNKLDVTNNLTTTQFDLNTNLSTLVSSISTTYDIDVTINSAVTDNGLLLKPGTVTVKNGETNTIDGAKQVDIYSVIRGNEIIQSQAVGVIAYVAGYDTIPFDLQLVCTNMVNDALRVQLGTIKGYLHSESITNYSYTYSENINWYNILAAYQGQLGFYKNATF